MVLQYTVMLTCDAMLGFSVFAQRHVDIQRLMSRHVFGDLK